MKPGSVLEVEIEKAVYRGLGLGRVEGQVVFVPRGLPGDRWRARVTALERGYLRAEPESLLRPGPGRRDSPCGHFPACGGCAYQELSYSDQLSLKEAVLRESLRRGGVPWEGAIAVFASPEQGWRTRAVFHVGRVDGRVRVGLYREDTRQIVEISRCLQISSSMRRVLEATAEALRRQPLLRVDDIVLAESRDGSELVLCLEGADPRAVAAEWRRLLEIPGLTGSGVRVSRGGRGQGFSSLRGSPHVTSAVLGVALRGHVFSFFQGNRFLVEVLAGQVREWLTPGGQLVDLFCGVGLFSLSVASRFERVRGVELATTAVADARFNAERNAVANVRFTEGDARQALASIPEEPKETVVLDPPRAGAGADLVRAIAARGPGEIVYVSCDPTTLSRDLRRLAALGYRAERLAIFDMFPNTFHLESVALLRRG